MGVRTMFFNSKAKREKQIKEYEEQERQRREELKRQMELENKKINEYYNLYKNDEDIIKMVKRFYEGQHSSSPSKFVSECAFRYESLVDYPMKAYIQIDQERIRFHYDYGRCGDEILFKNCGFANVEDSIKQKAILLVFKDYFIKKSKECYVSKGLTNINTDFRLEKVFTFTGPLYSEYFKVGVKKDEYDIPKAYFDPCEHHLVYLDGAVITVTNNQPNVLRQL